jgi:hypothetical protein
MREPKTLKERLQYERASRIPGGAEPVAVSINGGELVYGEFLLEQERSNLTFFDGTPIEGGLWHWHVTVEAEILERGDVVTVRMGDTESQPIEGKAYVMMPRAQLLGPIQTKLQGFGELVRHD